MDPLTRIRKLLEKPTVEKWMACVHLVNLYKQVSLQDSGMIEVVDRCVAYMRTWYSNGAAAIGIEGMRSVYGPEEGNFFTFRRTRQRIRPRPSIAKFFDKPLPSPTSAEYKTLMGYLSTDSMCKAVFAGLERMMPGKDPILLLAIRFRRGYDAVGGLLLREMYAQRQIGRMAWKLNELPPEHELIEDWVLFLIINTPGIRSRSIRKSARQLNPFPFTMDLDCTLREIWSATLRLQRAGRIFQPVPNRWGLTYMGQVAAWADLPTAWVKFTVRPRGTAHHQGGRSA